MTINRRRWVSEGVAGIAGLGLLSGLAGQDAAAQAQVPAAGEDVVRLSGDGLGLTPPQYSRLLARLADEQGIGVDNYSIGGVIEELETAFARLLGKERAVFMPTGTLANHLAIRALAGNRLIGPSIWLGSSRDFDSIR